MRPLPCTLLLLMPLALAAAEIQPGDNLAHVRETLGAPRGQAESGGRLLLYYERGEVELQDGVVTRAALLSRDDHEAETARRAAKARRLRDEREINRARLTTEGEELKARKLADPAFRSGSAAAQVAFWEDFSRRYPDVPGREELLLARLRLAEENEAKRREAETAERIARLEARRAAAEARAAEAAERPRVYRSFYAPGQRPGHPQNLWPIDYGDFNFSHPLGTPLHRLGGSIGPELKRKDEERSRYLRRPRERHAGESGRR